MGLLSVTMTSVSIIPEAQTRDSSALSSTKDPERLAAACGWGIPLGGSPIAGVLDGFFFMAFLNIHLKF